MLSAMKQSKAARNTEGCSYACAPAGNGPCFCNSCCSLPKCCTQCTCRVAGQAFRQHHPSGASSMHVRASKASWQSCPVFHKPMQVQLGPPCFPHRVLGQVQATNRHRPAEFLCHLQLLLKNALLLLNGGVAALLAPVQAALHGTQQQLSRFCSAITTVTT